MQERTVSTEELIEMAKAGALSFSPDDESPEITSHLMPDEPILVRSKSSPHPALELRGAKRSLLSSLLDKERSRKGPIG